MSNFEGKKICDADGNEFVIKKAKYTGLATGANLKVIKRMSIQTECGRVFNTTESDLKTAMANLK